MKVIPIIEGILRPCCKEPSVVGAREGREEYRCLMEMDGKKGMKEWIGDTWYLGPQAEERL